MVGEILFNLLDFGIDHVTCFSHWDVNGYDTNRSLECPHMAGIIFCVLTSLMALKNREELNPSCGLSQGQLSLAWIQGTQLTCEYMIKI
jgi:hypothetical protein